MKLTLTDVCICAAKEVINLESKSPETSVNLTAKVRELKQTVPFVNYGKVRYQYDKLKRSLSHINSLSKSLPTSKPSLIDTPHQDIARRTGRPTNKEKNVKKEKLSKAINEVAQKYDKLKSKSIQAGKNKLPNTELDKIIHDVSNRYELSDDQVINPRTIQQRWQRGSIFASNKLSPIASVEPYIAAVVIEINKANMGLSPIEVINLANEFIFDTEHELLLKQYQKHHGIPVTGEVTTCWYKGFVKRYKECIKTKLSKNVAFDRLKWATYDNIL